ncbi:hypothetical protein H5410_006795 [Solanum commersonii]|uniref:Uncharacterized protein n=1 Tax=Solanum commersonii TaxID=4109 RepID=A0A9J6AAT1_SOLCO|nr:hypothetical protein H5410_006795 [Solanum commersonii]
MVLRVLHFSGRVMAAEGLLRRKRWQRRDRLMGEERKEFDRKGAIFWEEKTYGEGEGSGKEKSVADGLYLF